MPRAYELGRDIFLVDQHVGEFLLEGRARLSPGRVAVLLSPGRAAVWRTVFITDWRVIVVGDAGPVYRGRGHAVAATSGHGERRSA